MAFRIDIPRNVLNDLIKTKIDIYERRMKAEPNKLIGDILQKDIDDLNTAKSSITEIK